MIYDEQIPNFYRTLKIDFDSMAKQDVSAALSSLANEISKLEPYHSAGVWFKDYSEESTGGGELSFVYWLIDKEEQEAIDYLEHDYTASSFEYLESGDAKVKLIQLRSYPGKGQHDIARLFSTLVDALEKKDEIKILDMSLHDIDDDSGNSRPILRIYYTENISN